MSTRTAHKESDTYRAYYLRQNRAIHEARAQICMELDDCRELAQQEFGKASLRKLSLRERWELIEILKTKGAKVKNPPLSEAPGPVQGRYQMETPVSGVSSGPASIPQGICLAQSRDRPQDVYPSRLQYWNKRFPKRRPGYASNEQLAWIEALFILYFDDGRAGDYNNALRKFTYRQTMNLEQGPVSDIAFLKDHQVQALIMPLKIKAKERR